MKLAKHVSRSPALIIITAFMLTTLVSGFFLIGYMINKELVAIGVLPVIIDNDSSIRIWLSIELIFVYLISFWLCLTYFAINRNMSRMQKLYE